MLTKTNVKPTNGFLPTIEGLLSAFTVERLFPVMACGIIMNDAAIGQSSPPGDRPRTNVAARAGSASYRPTGSDQSSN